MKTGQNTFEMTIGSWLVAFLAGTLAGIMLWVLGDWRFFQAVFAGGVIFIVLGLIISSLMSKPLSPPNQTAIEPKTPGETAAKVKKTPPTVEANKGKIKPSTPLPGQSELAARKGDWSYQSAPAAPAPAAAKADPAPAATPASGEADDLKLIGGVGPALEKKLNDAGITRFEQIANMSPEDVAMIEEKLSFKGRMERDDWRGQAKILAAGGETEFSKKSRKS
jgi:NADH-quinone oxidoreductase subunit E